MLLSSFEYRVAHSVEEAIALLCGTPGASPLAGGTDLLPQLRGRRRTPLLVDVKRIPGLGGVSVAGGGLRIGATATMAEVVEHPEVIARYPLLRASCLEVGAYPLRNRATVVGNICNGSPAADAAVALLALDAEVVIAGTAGGRVVPIGDFFLGPGKTGLADGELVLEIRLPAAAGGGVGAYRRLSRRQGMDLATVGVAVGRSAAGKHRVALCAVAPTPLRVRESEELLDREGAGGVRRAAELARAAASPISDIRGSADYRREMVGVLLARAVADICRGNGRDGNNG